MTLTDRQRQIASLIDRDVQKIGQRAKNLETGEEAVIELMPKYMHEFKHMLDTLGSDGMNQVCEDYPGFFIFAQMMERIAEGCQDGIFDDVIAKKMVKQSRAGARESYDNPLTRN